MKKIRVFVLAAFLVCMFSSLGQNTITGTVVNSKNKPVSNAIIYLDSVNSGIKTNKKGVYKVNLPKNIETINVYSYKHGLLSSKFGNEKVMNFVFLDTRKTKKPRIKKGADVVLSYSEEEQKFVAHSTPDIKSKDEKSLTNYNSIFDLIRGRVAGVAVSSSNQIRIRGVNSVVGSGNPLFVVDGTPTNAIDNILPVNVARIKVLKGPAASIYGSRGSNGVIVIDTKN